MRLPVFIEPVANNGYRARGACDLSAEGATPAEALGNLQKLIDARLKDGASITSLDVPSQENPWQQFAGMFKDDPLFDDWQKAIADYRRQVDEDPDVP